MLHLVTADVGSEIYILFDRCNMFSFSLVSELFTSYEQRADAPLRSLGHHCHCCPNRKSYELFLCCAKGNSFFVIWRLCIHPKFLCWDDLFLFGGPAGIAINCTIWQLLDRIITLRSVSSTVYHQCNYFKF